MRQWLDRFYRLDAYRAAMQRRRALAAYAILTLLTVLFAIMAVVITLRGANNPIIIPVFLVVLVVSWVAVRNGRLEIAGWAIIGVFFVNIASAFGRGWTTTNTTFLMFPILLAALLVGPRSVVVAAVLEFLAVLGVALSLPDLDMSSTVVVEIIALEVGVIAAAILVFLLSQGWQRGLELAKQEAASRRLQMAELSATITQRLFQRLEMEALLRETVETIRDGFEEIYHAQVFLIDEQTGYAVLRASTGTVGRELMRRKHQLAVGSESVIGQVAARGEPVIAHDTSTDAVHKRNELLPDTRTELALPLISGERVIGALDVQAMAANAFTAEDVEVLQTLANQIAVAIDNAQLFEEQQRYAADNRRLAEQTQQQLTQIELLNRQMTGQRWERFLAGQELVPALTVDFGSGAMTPNAEWTPSLTQAVEAAQTVQTATPDQAGIVSVPLTVRGQVIGAMEFELDSPGGVQEDQALLVRDVADRLALSLENSRLFENAQRLARREAAINTIGADLQTTVGIENALRTALEGLQDALGAPRVAIQLGKPPRQPDAADQQEVRA